MTFADANIFLRFLTTPVTEADRARSEACRALFERVAHGDEELTTSEAVLSEIVYVLGSPRQYGLTPSEIAGRLQPILALRGLRIANKQRYMRALELFAQHRRLDFEDALSVTYVELSDPPELYSYDRDFDVFEQLTRREPTTRP